MAILSVSGRVSDHVRYYVSVNPVSETIRGRRAARRSIFFPNDPSLFAASAQSSSATRKTD